MKGDAFLDTIHLIWDDVIFYYETNLYFCTYKLFISATDVLFWFDFLNCNFAVLMRAHARGILTRTNSGEVFSCFSCCCSYHVKVK